MPTRSPSRGGEQRAGRRPVADHHRNPGGARHLGGGDLAAHPTGAECGRPDPDPVAVELCEVGDLLDQLGVLGPARVGGVEPLDVGQQDQQPRLEQHRHLSREEVVVAERDLVGRRRVVFVHDRHDAPVEQTAERLARVQVVHPRSDVERGQQHLGGVELGAGEALLVGPKQRALADRRRRLKLVDRSAAAPRRPISRMPRAIAPEVTRTTFSPPACSSATWAQTLSSTGARSSPSSSATIEDPSFATTVTVAQV